MKTKDQFGKPIERNPAKVGQTLEELHKVTVIPTREKYKLDDKNERPITRKK